jgi:hypothetical protein
MQGVENRQRRKQGEGLVNRAVFMKVLYVQGGALNRGLFFADPPPPLLGAVSGKISEVR